MQNIANKTLGIELRPMGTGNSHEPDQDPEIKFMERAGPSHDPELDELERMVKELKMAIEEPIGLRNAPQAPESLASHTRTWKSTLRKRGS